MKEPLPPAPMPTFAPPSHGMWELETTHHGLRPLTPFLRDAYKRAFEEGSAVLVKRWGLPLSGVRAELVNGCFYVRPTGVGEGAKPMPTPPKFVMKLFARLHPEMRRRNRTAEQAWKERRWRTEVDRWFDHERAGVIAKNLAFQAVDLSALNDAELSGRVTELLEHFVTQARANLADHGGDLMPVGDLLAHCARWGIDGGEAASLLRGSSPATTETAQLLRPVATALRQSTSTPSSIEAIRNLSAQAHAAVDSWLELHAWRLVTSDDVDGPTLAEVPALQLAALLAADHDTSDEPPSVAAVLRLRVPENERATFDELVVEARYGNRQREDIRGVRWNWPAGLLRRALLEAGRRLVTNGSLRNGRHVVELSPAELAGLLMAGPRAGSAPGPDELAARAAERDRIEAMPPPRMLGDVEAPPPLDALPAPMARATTAMMSTLVADATAPDGEVLCGIGIGVETYCGRARIVTNVADAFERLEPGDILVASFIGPSFNSIIPMVGAVVVEEGGPLCHAAIVAREFGLPALVGARGATSAIVDGSQVEIDCRAGTIRRIDRDTPATRPSSIIKTGA